MTRASTHMSADEFFDYAQRHGRCELINGEVRHMSPAGGWHGDYTSRLHYYLMDHVLKNDLGNVYAAETGFRLSLRDDEHTVRAPDIAFVANDKLAQADTPKFIPVPPDLAVETWSPSDTPNAVKEKIKWWLDNGVRLLWELDPATKTLTVHQPDGGSRRLTAADTLDGGDVVPGFTMPLQRLFR